jgi:hypothetical protein
MKKITVVFAAVIVLLACAPAFAAADGTAGLSAFALKDGKVYKGGEALDCEVNEIPDAEGPVRYWSVFDQETSEEVTEGESGLWFFAADGKSSAFLPVDSELIGAVQNVIFSPGGERFLLETGPQYQPEAVYGVYETAVLEKKAEVDGVKGAVWIDPKRFVMTRIDGARDVPEPSPGRAFAYRASVVMYDAAASETAVLKESTDTKSYWLGEVIEEGGALSVREESVESEKDWGDEEKTGAREITVPVPPAG